MPRPELYELFQPGQSPYFNMYKAGLYGYTTQEVCDYCYNIGVAVREKDIENHAEGYFKNQLKREAYNMQQQGDALSRAIPVLPRPISTVAEVEDKKLSEFPLLPEGWTGNKHRFFPCTQDNKPMQRWGYSSTFTPTLYSQDDARLLSPCKWVGQNMLYQPFVVIDIDGVGHGVEDRQTIEFGRTLAQGTMVMEDPAKPGSFHIYFTTNRLIPVRHYPYAKIDLMGNAVNAAVYLKNKISNGARPLELTDNIWDALMAYQRERRKTNVGHYEHGQRR